MWRLGVLQRKWRPSHHVASHHFDAQPALAYLPGAIVVGLVFWYNSSRAADEPDQEEAASGPPAAATAEAAAPR